jgi:hypothetical protein
LVFGDEISCVYWNFLTNKWSSNGCKKITEDSNNDITICECNHLTDFAALLDISSRKYKMKGPIILKYAMIIIVICVIILTAILIIAIKYKRIIKIRTLIKDCRGKIEKYRKEKFKDMLKVTVEKNLLIERNLLNLQEILGSGNFGVVYKALFIKENDEIEVAVKTVKSGMLLL